MESGKAKLVRFLSEDCTKLDGRKKGVEERIAVTKATGKRIREEFDENKKLRRDEFERRKAELENELKVHKESHDAEEARRKQELEEELDSNGAVENEQKRELSGIEQQRNESQKYLDDLQNETEQHTMIISGPNELTEEEIGTLKDSGATVIRLLQERFLHRDVNKAGKNGC